MESHRLPRFRRVSTIAPLKVIGRDREIIRLVHRHRFLRSSQIIALIGGSLQQLLRRLKLLYHHGFLERPRAQIDYYHLGGFRHIVYGLGNKGGKLLKEEMGTGFRDVSWGERNRAVGRMFFEHALLVSDVMATLELACRKRGVRLITEEALRGAQTLPSFRWRVNLKGRTKLGIIPDRAFALEFQSATGTRERAYFFLEADRGTMPVTRRHLSQTSFYRKLLAYAATWAQNLHHSLWGFHRFRVITVATSSARVKSLVEACSQLEHGHGLFLFADRTILSDEILSAVWQTGKPGVTSRLLDEDTCRQRHIFPSTGISHRS